MSYNSYPVLINKITWQKGKGEWWFLDMYNKGIFPPTIFTFPEAKEINKAPINSYKKGKIK